jgi:hypothetical protein
MAWYRIPDLGSTLGPCLEPCEHRDCRQTHELATSTCRLCREVIGYGARVYFEAAGDRKVGAVHATCLETDPYEGSRVKRGLH